MVATENCPSTREQSFVSGTQPTKKCTLHSEAASEPTPTQVPETPVITATPTPEVTPEEPTPEQETPEPSETTDVEVTPEPSPTTEPEAA